MRADARSFPDGETAGPVRSRGVCKRSFDVATGSLPIVQVAARPPDHLVRRARLLAWWGLAWHVAEAAVAIGAGIAAGSIALVGFGADSLIEALAGLVIIWLASNLHAERRAQQLVAISFAILAGYVGVEALRDLIGAREPDVSWIGVGLSAVTLVAMPPLAAAKRRVGEQLRSSAMTSESRQTLLCAYMSAGLLAGLLANALLGWWWADPVAALGIGAIALREARDAWRGELCDCC
jgi:divalent metal cation (Fe/Co/Zn/Cd) transporter